MKKRQQVSVAAPRRIVFYSTDSRERTRDEFAMTLVAMGKGKDFISRQTGLRKGQVYYAQRKVGLRVTDFRNVVKGTLGGRLAEEELRRMMDIARPMVIREIHEKVPAPEV